MKISFIGSGNVATQMALALNRISSVKIDQIISRDRNEAKHLAQQVRADHTDDFSRINNFDLLIMAVSDDSIDEILEKVELPNNKIICHTAGSVSSEVLKNVSRKYGVIYPLQTLSKTKDVDWTDLPVFLTTSDDSTQKRLLQVIKQLTRETHIITDEQRFALHVSAVFACNFSNAMMQVSEQICQDNNLDYKLLSPLIAETFEKLGKMGPRHAQTGPARRGDTRVMQKHLDFLQDRALEKDIYKMVSDYIQSRS